MRPEAFNKKQATRTTATVEQEDTKDGGVATIYSVVYVTASASFSGPTAGFVTQGASSTSQIASKSTAQASKDTQDSDSESTATSAAQSSRTSAAAQSEKAASSAKQSSTASSASQHSSSVALSTTSDASSSSATATHLVGTPVRQASSTSSASATSAPSSGMSGGAKAGVAIGLILGAGLIAGLIFLVVRRKRRSDAEGHRKLDDEKRVNRFSDIEDVPPPNPSTARAPRLSLRPVTQFLPTLGDHRVQEMTNATGGLGGFGAPAAHKTANSLERKPVAEPVNPFGNHAETFDAAAEKAAENAPIPVIVPASDPFADKHASAGSKSPSDTSLPRTPPKAVVNTPAAVPVTSKSAGSPPKGPNNVHRVQLDFKPSMDDELELIAGQVVRIVHEYDDGWALCARMDRTKQGVAPRTCLSKMPLKPRPAGPPPNGRPSTPNSPRNFSGPPGGRMSPGPRDPMFPAPLSPSMNSFQSSNRGRPHSPMSSPRQGGRQRSYSHSQNFDFRGQIPRPQNRTMSPAPMNQHRRSASMGMIVQQNQNASQHSRKNSPTSPADKVPMRKPVPGMAI